MIAFLYFALAGDPAESGRYAVGENVVFVNDAYNDQRLVACVWTPAERQADGHLTPAVGRFPLLLFSHGIASENTQSTSLCRHLASHGYIVAAPDHPGTSSSDFRPLQVPSSVRRRPFELRAVLDYFQTEVHKPASMWFDKWDGRAAAFGHSLGGVTALAVAGAWLDARTVPTPPDGPRLDYIDAGDDRILAAAAFNGTLTPFFTTESIRRLAKPTLVFGCSLDRVTPVAPNQRRIYDLLAGPKYLGILQGGDHLSLADEDFIATTPFFVRMLHRPTIERATADRLIRARTTAFFDRYVKGDPRAEEYLRSGAAELEWSARP